MAHALRFDSMASLHAWAKRRTKPHAMTLDHVPSAQEVLSLMLRDAGIPHLYDTFQFHPRREWRADIAIGSPVWLIVEIDGNGTNGHPGAHRSFKGYEDDRERDAEALMLGYHVLRVTPRQVLNGRALLWVQKLLAMQEQHR